MASEDLAPGTQLGKYRITGRLGKGGMSVVYAGEDTRLGRAVAIKLLSEDLADDAEWLGRFQLEARAAARLNHPNVVTVHDVDQQGDDRYLVMELVQGGSVQGRLTSRGALPWQQATRIVADVCRGLSAAHAAGLLHRDVKPANILLAADGSAKLADFGLTKAPALLPTHATQAGAVLGTPQYMSPEHCSGEPLDERADLYSLGATYYALLTGRPPFDGPDPVQILYAHCSSPVPDPRSLVPSLPGEVVAIINRAMAKSRTERFRCAEEMLGALQCLLLATASSARLSAVVPVPQVPDPGGPATEQRPQVNSFDNGRQAASIDKPEDTSSRSGRRWLLAAGSAGVLVIASACVLLAAGVFRAAPATSEPTPPSTRPQFADAKSATSTSRPTSRPAPQRPAYVAQPASVGPLTLRPRAVAFSGHKGAVKSVSVVGNLLASAGEDGTARIWALDTGVELKVTHHPFGLDAVALSPDGKVLVAGGRSRTLFLWDAVTGQGLRTVPNFPGDITCVAFSPSGTQLAVASNNDLQLFDCETSGNLKRRTVLLARQYVVSAVAFSADGRRLVASTYERRVHVWDLDTLKKMTTPANLPDDLTTVACSADGSRIAFGTHHGALYLWEPDRDSGPILLSPNEANVATTAFSPRAAILASAGEWSGPIKLREAATNRTIRVVSGMSGAVNCLAFRADGKVLAAAGSDGSVRIWDVDIAAETKE